MEHTAFFSLMDKGQAEGTYLFCGEEEYVKERALDALLLGLGDMSELNSQILLNPSCEEIITACETMPCFAERRIIVVRDSDLLSSENEEAKLLAGYAFKLPPTSCLILFERGEAKKKTVYTALDKQSRVVHFNMLEEPEAVKWILTNSKRRKVSISQADARYMLAMVGRNVLDLSNELDKARAYAKDGMITREVISACVTKNTEYNVFQMLDAFISGDWGDGFRALDLMLYEGEAVSKILAFMAGRLRLICLAKSLLMQRHSVESTVKIMGGSPYAAKKAIEASKRFTLNELEDALKRLADADWAFKSGKQKDRLALETALMDIFISKKQKA